MLSMVLCLSLVESTAFIVISSCHLVAPLMSCIAFTWLMCKIFVHLLAAFEALHLHTLITAGYCPLIITRLFCLIAEIQLASSCYIMCMMPQYAYICAHCFFYGLLQSLLTHVVWGSSDSVKSRLKMILLVVVERGWCMHGSQLSWNSWYSWTFKIVLNLSWNQKLSWNFSHLVRMSWYWPLLCHSYGIAFILYLVTS